MPIYEYRCASCQNKSSFFVRTVETPVEAVCGSCGSRDMERLISAVFVPRAFRSADDVDFGGSFDDDFGDESDDDF